MASSIKDVSVSFVDDDDGHSRSMPHNTRKATIVIGDDYHSIDRRDASNVARFREYVCVLMCVSRRRLSTNVACNRPFPPASSTNQTHTHTQKSRFCACGLYFINA